MAFEDQIKIFPFKVCKTKGLLHKLNKFCLDLLWSRFTNHLYNNNTDVIFDKAFNHAFYRKLNSLQNNDALGTTEAIKASSAEKYHQGLRIELLQSWRLLIKLSFFYKIL